MTCRFVDNLKELDEKFELVTVPYPEFASGTMYRCKLCGDWAKSQESWFPCQQKFITQRVVCYSFPRCTNHWRLHIEPEADGKKELSLQ